MAPPSSKLYLGWLTKVRFVSMFPSVSKFYPWVLTKVYSQKVCYAYVCMVPFPSKLYPRATHKDSTLAWYFLATYSRSSQKVRYVKFHPPALRQNL